MFPSHLLSVPLLPTRGWRTNMGNFDSPENSTCKRTVVSWTVLSLLESWLVLIRESQKFLQAVPTHF